MYSVMRQGLPSSFCHSFMQRQADSTHPVSLSLIVKHVAAAAAQCRLCCTLSSARQPGTSAWHDSSGNRGANSFTTAPPHTACIISTAACLGAAAYNLSKQLGFIGFGLWPAPVPDRRNMRKHTFVLGVIIFSRICSLPALLARRGRQNRKAITMQRSLVLLAFTALIRELVCCRRSRSWYGRVLQGVTRHASSAAPPIPLGSG